MAQVAVKNLKNEVVGKLELADEVFAYSASETLVWEAVRAFQAAQRKGTHATRNRARVRGGGHKPWRQKGTGRARSGSSSSPIWRKGGTVFGPSPRDYAFSFPRRKRRGAIKLVLSDKLQRDRLVVVETLELESHRTRDFRQLLETLDLGRKVLVVEERQNRNAYLGCRNLPGVKMVQPIALNIYDLLNCEHMLVSKRALLALEEGLKR